MSARRCCRLVFGLVSVAAAALPAPGARMPQIDRLLAAVNGVVITQGDLELAGSLSEILIRGRGPQGSKPQQELDRLIDLELLRQELENFRIGESEEDAAAGWLAELRKSYAEIGGLAFLLERLGLSEDELKEYLVLQSRILRLVGMRFRPFVNVTDEEINSYYSLKLVPELRRHSAPVPELAQVSDKIREILTEQEVNAAMEEWLRNMRQAAKIEFFTGMDVPQGDAKS